MWEMLSFGDQGFGDEILAGAWLTLQLAVVSLGFGLVLGLAAASARLSRSRLARGVARGYTELVRGVPEMLVVLVVFFGASALLQTVVGWFGYDDYIEVNAFLAGTFALALVFGAFASEVLRGAFLAVPQGQIEAGIACGMTPWQVFHRIRLPQMWRFALPGLGNLWMVLLKDTSLISVIALDELLRWSKVAAETTKQPFTFYAVAALIYLLLAIVSDGARLRMERWASRGVPRAN
ncbi:MAG: ABC transporter permease subunit [Proteobacteria bacterium]|nr:MAG: ABC transporter permease subunit [Pseudomonadota bacterium]